MSDPRIIDFNGTDFYLVFPYIPTLKEDLKSSCRGARWEPVAKVWIVPQRQAANVGKFALRNEFKVSDTALAAFKEEAEPKPKPKVIEPVVDGHNDNWRLSWAIDSDIEVEVPEGLELYGFQKADIEYVLKNLKPGKGSFLADKMGLGKSPQAALTLKEKNAYPAVITQPRVVWLKWAKELQTWTPGVRTVMLSGKVVGPIIKLLAKRWGATVVKLGDPIPEADVYLIKYSVLDRWLFADKPSSSAAGKSKYKKVYTATGPLTALKKLGGVIFDESHYLKDEKAKRTQAALALVNTLKPTTRLNLSGTPFLNKHIELLPQLWLIDGLQAVARDEWDFLNLYCNPNGYEQKGKFGYYEFDGSVNGDLLNHRMRAAGIYAQHEKNDRVLEGVHVPGVLNQLPPLIPDYIPAELANQKRYDVVQADLKDARKTLYFATRRLESAVAMKMPPARLAPLRAAVNAAKNACGVLTNEALKVCGEEKVPFAIEWIQEWLDGAAPDEKLIVFAHHRPVNKTLADHFGAPLIIGGQNDGTRQAAQDAFQDDPNVRLIICSLKAANVGIDLTAATHIRFVEVPQVPAHVEQGVGRGHGRLNDVHGVVLEFLVYYSDDPGDNGQDRSIDEKTLQDVLGSKELTLNISTSGSTQKLQPIT